MKRFSIQPIIVTILIAFVAAGFGGCFGGYNVMGLHLFSIKIEVRGPNNAALVGAVVNCSCGETVTIDTTGIATLHFSDVGPYYVSVVYQDRVISSYNVSIPSDDGKKLTTNYAPATAQPTTTTETAPPVDNSGLAMMMTRLYPILFQYMFSAYGYNMELNPYQPGQYTDWTLTGKSGKPFETRKAFLTTLPDGKEWWGLTYISNKDSIIMEVMFSEKHQSIRRMRQKFGNDTPKEVPVTEGWYTAPMQLTPESVEGAVVKKGVSVTVPAGSYTCDQIEFAVGAGNMTLRMWRTTSVPGGVVKYEMVDKGGDTIYTGELKSTGTGAATQLGSY
ncbi:MAG TPA: hypothetical protein VLX91_03585 [Candidatus Acidoferrales bacterium]|nr:hypothetical protein [Candidatus Acidoferrales bacterium]